MTFHDKWLVSPEGQRCLVRIWLGEIERATAHGQVKLFDRGRTFRKLRPHTMLIYKKVVRNGRD
jgi:hypothetical protein